MPTRYSYDANGNLTASNDTYSFFHGGINNGALPEDVQQYLLEFNQAQQQYQQQYQLQKDAFDLNKQNLEFNQNLSTRQQDFAENSWKNNITNSARQMATLGINPAASGSGISGPTMSGGSQVSGINPGSVSGRSVQRFNNKATKIQLLSTLLQHAKDKKALDISQQEADTHRISALSQAGLADSTSSLNKATIEFFNKNGYMPGSGYGSTQSGFDKDHVFRIITSVIGAGIFADFIKRHSGNGKNPPSAPSGEVYDAVWEDLHAFQERSGLDIQPSTIKSGVPMSTQVSDAFKDASSSEVFQALQMLIEIYSAGMAPNVNFGGVSL